MNGITVTYCLIFSTEIHLQKELGRHFQNYNLTPPLIILMKNRITLPVAFFLLLNFQLSALDYQTLTDVQGRSIQAHIWKVEGNEAFLEVPGGRKFRISTQVFSPQSQALLQQYANRVATPPAPPSPPPFGGSTPPPPPAFSTPTVASTPPAVSASGALIDSDVAIYPNAAVICKVDGARIAGSPFAQAIKAQMKPPGAPETPSDMPFGLTQDDVQSLAFSISSFDGLDFGKLSKSGPEALKELPPNVKFAMAVTFSKPIDMATARQEIMEGSEAPVTFTEYAGATLVPMPQDAGVPPNYGAAIKNQGSGSIFLIGETPHLRGVLDGSIPPGAASLAQEDISLAVNVPAAFMDQLAATSQDNPLMAGLMVFLKQMNRITLGMSFNQAANINLAAHFADPAAAQQLSQMLAPMVASMTSKPGTPLSLNNWRSRTMPIS